MLPEPEALPLPDAPPAALPEPVALPLPLMPLLPPLMPLPERVPVLDASGFASDGFHGSELGYRAWAAHVVGAVLGAAGETPRQGVRAPAGDRKKRAERPIPVARATRNQKAD